MKLKLLSQKEALDYFKEKDEYSLALDNYPSNLEIIGSKDSNEFHNKFLSSFIDFTESDISYYKILEDRLNVAVSDLNSEDEIYLVKATNNHSLAIIQTRKNAVICYQNPGLSLLVHEIYHVLSRKNPGLTKELSKIFGFKEVPEVIIKDPEYLLNPDHVKNNLAIEVNYKGSVINVIPYLILGLNVGLYDPENDKIIEVSETDYKFNEFNTFYCGQAEEICAENFALAFTDSCIFKTKNINETFLSQFRTKVISLLS